MSAPPDQFVTLQAFNVLRGTFGVWFVRESSRIQINFSYFDNATLFCHRIARPLKFQGQTYNKPQDHSAKKKRRNSPFSRKERKLKK